MMDRLKDFKWAVMIGASVVSFLFSTFATNAAVSDLKEDIMERLKDIQETLHRIDERQYNKRR